MATKPTGPALYELMRGRRREAPEAPEPEPPAPPPPTGRLGPGGAVRVPVGYLLLAAAVVLAVVVAAFTVGYSRGRQEAKAELERAWVATNLPLALPPPEDRGPAPPGPAAPETMPEPAATEGPAEAPAGAGPVLSDPREPGKNYFVLIHTQRDNAIRLAQFCRQQGVEAYAVRAKNLSLYKVVALPGYGRGERAADFVRALEQRIEEVVRRWKVQVNPRDELAYYPEKYEG
jgi:hypothetical protein